MDSTSYSRVNLDLLQMIFSYIKKGHPLAAPITKEESLSLASNLVKRLGIEKLDFSPISLRILESALIKYHEKMVDEFPSESTLLLLRELAAYIGDVIAQNTDGQWSLLNDSIWGTSLIYEGQWEILKENRRTMSQKVRYILVDIAATAWQNVLDGKRPKLYSLYESIKKREMREETTYKYKR